MRCSVATLVATFVIPCTTLAQLQYPQTKKSDSAEDYHGIRIADPYRWLEDDHSEETKAWVIAQNKTTQQYLSTIPYRQQLKKRLEELWNYPRYSSPFKEGSYYYFYKNDGLQNRSSLFELGRACQNRIWSQI